MEEALTKGERTRQAIIESAYSLFLAGGYHGTSMRQIADQAGVALSGIYNHFSGKEEIFDQIILEKHPYRQILPILEAAPGDSVEDFLNKATQAIFQELGRRPDFVRLIFIELVEFQGAHAPMLVQAVVPQFIPLLARFQAAGGDLREIPVPVIIRAFFGVIFSYYITEYLIGQSELTLFKDTKLDDFVDIFLHGILKPQSPENQ